MEFITTHTALTDILHAFSQALLAPDIILLLLFAAYAVFCIGSVITEYFTERRNFKVTMPKFLAALMAADEDEIPNVVASSGLLNRQKIALLTVYDYRTLPGDAMVALIRRTVNIEETRYDRITSRNGMAAKISPMLGLMGTLIPLGPGIAALGQADTAALSSSLLIAFDTTVAGLVVAAVCMAVGKIRSNWYGDYMSALDSGMATMLQKIEDMRAEGKITVSEPTDYAFMFEESIAKEKAAAKAAKAAKKSQAAEAAQVADEVAAENGVVPAAADAAEAVAEEATSSIPYTYGNSDSATPYGDKPATASSYAPTTPYAHATGNVTPTDASKTAVLDSEAVPSIATDAPVGSRMAARLAGRHVESGADAPTDAQ